MYLAREIDSLEEGSPKVMTNSRKTFNVFRLFEPCDDTAPVFSKIPREAALKLSVFSSDKPGNTFLRCTGFNSLALLVLTSGS